MQLSLGLNETLGADLWRACDILRRDNNVGGVMQYTEHLAWLLFLKFFDQEEKKRAQEAALRGETYTPVLPPDLSWDAWASLAALQKWDSSRGQLVAFVRGRLLPGLASLNGSPLANTIARLFSDESIGDQTVVRNVPVCASDYNLKEVLTLNMLSAISSGIGSLTTLSASVVPNFGIWSWKHVAGCITSESG